MIRELHYPFNTNFHVCMSVTSISKPFDHSQKCEIRFDLSPCHGVKGGSLYLHVEPADAYKFQFGDEYSFSIHKIA